MKRLLCSIMLMILSVAPGRGQVGETGLAFLKLGVGGRSLGMGEAYSAVASDPSAMYYNPASLAINENSAVLLMHKEWIQDTRTEYIAAKAAMSNLFLGVSVNATSVNNIDIREVPGPSQGTFDAHSAAIGLTGAYRLDSSLSIGATGKYLYEKILVNEASGFGADLGATYLTPWNLRLALAVSNLGSMNTLDNEETKFPTIIRAGGAYVGRVEAIEGTVTISSDVVTVTAEHLTHLNLGGEINYRETLSIRIGYQSGYDAKSFSTGVGFRYSQFQLDYAFVPTKYDLGSTHTFSLLIEFN